MSAAPETLPASNPHVHMPTASSPVLPIASRPVQPKASGPVPPSVSGPVPPSASVPVPPIAPVGRTGIEHTVHWFRKGLRLHDNPALREGLADAATFRCVFIIDPWLASSSNVFVNKWRFLLQCLEDLDTSLKKLNSRLFVVRGQPADVLPKLFREWGTTLLTFEEDPEPYGRVRDHNIMSKCRDVGIKVKSRVSHTLYKLDQIIELNGGKAPLTYHQFQALIASMPPPPPAEAAISLQTINRAVTPITEDHDARFGVPTLEELGFETEDLKPPVWIGGESEALVRLERHLERKAWVTSFGRPKMTPQSLLASQTGLSPYLRFGCLSTRLFYYQLTDLYKRVKRVRPPLSLHGQILWREFFYCAATRNPNFDRMEGNPICVQIPWEKNQEALAKWASGQTGFPWIDAIMIQLREEGWIHHLARHAVACFLTRGDLWISWEEGMKVFDELMLDADWSVNAGMWMWLSCSSFFQQFFHCYCPVRFGRRIDPNGDYIRRYIPALKNMPTRYIYEPWLAPENVQQSAKCVIGRDYPMPMIDHAHASQINIERIKQVYAQLAKYKPQARLSSQPVSQANVMQSSPSPTSIITNINQSKYLCSQTSDAQTSTQIVNKESDEIYKLSMQNNSINNLNKKIPYKEVVIVSQVQHDTAKSQLSEHTSQENFTPNQQLDVSYKPTITGNENLGSYDQKNVNIHKYVDGYSSTQEIYDGQVINRHEYNQQSITVNDCGYEKRTYYILDNNSHNQPLQTFTATTLNCDPSLSYIDNQNEVNKYEINDMLHVTVNSNGSSFSNDPLQSDIKN